MEACIHSFRFVLKSRDHIPAIQQCRSGLWQEERNIPIPSFWEQGLHLYACHISHVTKTAFFHLRNIAKLQNMLPVSDAEKLVHVFMTSRLDYCNALLAACPASLINKLQVLQNAAARVLTRSRKYDHISPILQSLHWLPIKFRISYKILLLIKP